MNEDVKKIDAQDTDKNNARTLYKHASLIHCENKTTLLERKVYNVLLFNALPNLNKELIHEISLSKLKSLLGVKTRNHKKIKEALLKLMSMVIEWNLCNDSIFDGINGWQSSTMLASVSINCGVIKYQYSELLKPVLSDPSVYGKINIKIQSKFKSLYSLILYENCIRYNTIGSTKKFEYSLLRQIMGVGDKKYKKFYEFKKRVLDPAIKEIYKLSGTLIKANVYRKHNRVVKIKFEIKNDNTSKKREKKEDTCFSDLFLKKIRKIYGEKKVRLVMLQFLNSNSYKNGKIIYNEKYILAMLNNIDKSKSKHNQNEKRLLKEKNIDNDIMFSQRIYKKCQNLDKTQREKIEQDFLLNGTKFFGKYTLRHIQNGGLSNPLLFDIDGGIHLFIQKYYPEIINEK